MLSKFLLYIIRWIVPAQHMRDIVNGEIIRRQVTLADPQGLLYAHSPGSLYGAHRLARGLNNRIHFFPLSPQIYFKNNQALFRHVTRRDLSRMLRRLRRLRPSLRSIIAIGAFNAPMARWWADWYDLPSERRYYVKAAWALDPRQLERQAFGIENRSRLRAPATFILDMGSIRKTQLLKILSAFTAAHPRLQVIALIDTDDTEHFVTEIAHKFETIDLQIIDRRTVKRWKRWAYLLKGLSTERVQSIAQSRVLAPRALWHKMTGVNPSKPVSISGERPNAILNPIASEPDPTFRHVMTGHLPDRLKHWAHEPRKITKQIGIFRENAAQFVSDMTFDLILSFDSISAPTGQDIANICGRNVQKTPVPHMIDFNETLRFEERISDVFTTLSPQDMDALHTVCFQGASQAMTCTASSERLARQAEKIYGMPVTPVYNFHPTVDLSAPTLSMRDDFGIPDDAVVLVHCCTYAKAYHSDALIDVIAALPAHFHLVMVGQAATVQYGERFQKRIKSRGLNARIHIKGTIAPAQPYLRYLSTADMSLILLNTEIATVRDGLANRFIDSLGAGLPTVSTPAFESAKIIKTHGLGQVCESLEPAKIAEAVIALHDQMQTDMNLRDRVETARAKFTHDNERKKFLDIVAQNIRGDRDQNLSGRTPSACFVFQRGLARNKRILRLAQNLIRAGWSVTLLSGARPPDAVIARNPQIKFYRVPANWIWSDAACAAEKANYDTHPPLPLTAVDAALS